MGVPRVTMRTPVEGPRAACARGVGQLDGVFEGGEERGVLSRGIGGAEQTERCGFIFEKGVGSGIAGDLDEAFNITRVVAPCQSTVSRPPAPVVVTSPAGQVGVCWSSATVRAWPAASTTRRALTPGQALLEPAAGNVRVGFAGLGQVSRSTTSVVQNPCLAGAADCDDAQ